MADKVGDVFIDIKGRFDKLQKGVNQASNKIDKNLGGASKKLDKSFGNLGKRLVAVFAVQKIAAFTGEAIKLAGVADGVNKAFERLGDPTLLNALKDATRGTVSELELMKQAVQSKNLGVPIENLANLFAFATQRAADTGESVDHLVKSITVGIGRKSPLILDNLGISAVALKEALGGTSLEMASVGDIAAAVGKIASKSMSEIGETALTAGQDVQVMLAEMEDLKLKIGNGLIPVMRELLTITRDVALGYKILFTEATTESENFRKNIEKGFDPQTLGEARVMFKEIKDQIKGQNGAAATLSSTLIKNNAIIRKRLRFAETFTGESKKLALAEAARLTALNKMIARELKIRAAKRQTTLETEAAAVSVRALQTELKLMQDNQLDSKDVATWEAYAKVIEGIKDDINAIKGLRALKEAPVSDISQKGMPSLGDPLAGAGQLQDTTQFDTTQEKLDGINLAYETMGDKLLAVGSVAKSAFGMMANAAHESGNKTLATFAAVGSSLADIAMAIIAQQMAVSQANAISIGTSSGAAAGPAAVVATPLFIASMLGLVISSFASIPKFAMGGRSGGGMAMVGERGPELVNLPNGAMVTPNNQLNSVFSGSQGDNISLLGTRIYGRDIQFSNSRTSKFNTRTTGI